jgi:hypothetical protein
MKLEARQAVALTIGFFSVALGCSSKAGTRDEFVVYPPPPDTARIQFLARISDSRDVARSRSMFQVLVGEREDEVDEIIKPFGISMHEGKIYICDTVLAGVEIIDLEQGSFEYFQPQGSGRLALPVNCFVDKSNGWLYVADTGREEVVIFDESGQFVNSLAVGETGRPTDVYVDAAGIWIADQKGQRIRLYAKGSLELLLSFPENLAPGDSAYLRQPTNLHVTDDYVYVTDFGAFNIKVFTRQGEWVRSFGQYGDGWGQFVRPKGLAVDRENITYVVDAAFSNVQMFNDEGKLLMFFGGAYKGRPGDMYLPAQVTIDYDNVSYFEQHVRDDLNLKYLILVTNQYGPDKVTVYGFVESKSDAPGDG